MIDNLPSSFLDLMGEDVSGRLSSNRFTQGVLFLFWSAVQVLIKWSSCKQLSGWGCKFLVSIMKDYHKKFYHFSWDFVLKSIEKHLRGNSRKERGGLFCSAAERAA